MADGIVGFSDRVDRIVRALQPDPLGQDSVRVWGLHGMGGIGKTTLASLVLNKLSSRFAKDAVIEVGQDADILQKQRELIDALGDQARPAASVGEASRRLVSLLRVGPPVLLVLDSVWTLQQRDALLFAADMRPGSRVVITTRNLQILEGGAAHGLETVGGLVGAEAKALFCWHAFRNSSCQPAYEQHVEQALGICHGVPLALKVVGSSLSSLPAAHWPVSCLLSDSA